MVVSFARTIFLYFLVILSYRLMGKRQIGELQPIELGIAIMISELASIPMQDKDIPLLNGIIPILVLTVTEIGISYLTLKNKRIRDIVSGTPSVIICRGKIMQDEMEKIHFTLDDLLEQLRGASYPNVSDIDYAILETNGQMSIVPKPGSKGVSRDDLKISNSGMSELPYTVISDGEIQYQNLSILGKDETWLKKCLAANNISKPRDIFYMSCCENGGIYIQKYSRKDKKK